MGKSWNKSKAVAKEKALKFWDKCKKNPNACKMESGKKTVIEAAVKPKLLTQTPCGMANSTKACPYIPPAKKNTKPNLQFNDLRL